MALARTYSAQVNLLDAVTVRVEIDVSKGMHAFSIVGLPDKAVEEAKDRVASAVKNTGFASPKSSNHKTIVSLAPAQIKKEGAVFDLPIALAYLSAVNEIDVDLTNVLFAGELALDGSLRSITGSLSLARHAQKNGFSAVVVPVENAPEAGVIDGVRVYGARSLAEVLDHISGRVRLTPETGFDTSILSNTIPDVDMAEVQGQESAKRGLMIAATGNHNVAMSGPPGVGKTMLAKACSGILPAPDFNEMLEITAIHSVAGELADRLMTHRPFRAPHHSSSHVSLIGGGTKITPGEATLAHRGVLFCDEFPEFDRRVIESLREPLEEGKIQIARASGRTTFPASFIFIASMNPCPCGNYGVEGKQCECSPYQVDRYRRKISGPIVDRIDLWLDVHAVDYSVLQQKSTNQQTSMEIRNAVEKARNRAIQRAGKPNAHLTSTELTNTAHITDDARQLLTQTAQHYALSARGYYKVLMCARTIADIEESDCILADHIAEAVQYRPKAEQ